MPERKQRMTEYAIKLTKRPRAMEEGDILILRECGFSDRDILDINMIASYFNFVNRIALGLGVEFSSEEVTGYNV
ncbi:MAG TPA: peroxidase [Thermoplasmatales archaeon]|nr:peroxidase [Thermoplasmatales archaeon]